MERPIWEAFAKRVNGWPSSLPAQTLPLLRSPTKIRPVLASVATPSVAPTADGRSIREGLDIAAVVEVGALVVEVVVDVVVVDRVVVVVDRADAAVDVVVDVAATLADVLAVVVELSGVDPAADVDGAVVVVPALLALVEVGADDPPGMSEDGVSGSLKSAVLAVRANADGAGVVVDPSLSSAASTVPDDEQAVSSSATNRSPTKRARRRECDRIATTPHRPHGRDPEVRGNSAMCAGQFGGSCESSRPWRKSSLLSMRMDAHNGR